MEMFPPELNIKWGAIAKARREYMNGQNIWRRPSLLGILGECATLQQNLDHAELEIERLNALLAGGSLTKRALDLAVCTCENSAPMSDFICARCGHPVNSPSK